MLPRIEVKSPGPRNLSFLCGLWHRAWYQEFTPEAQERYRMRILTTPWARKRMKVLCLTEEGVPRSGMILLRFHCRISGRKLRTAGVAAVVTDPDHQKRGLAARLLQVAHRRLADSGVDLAMLFTGIGPAYYERLGYVTWPATSFTISPPSGTRGEGSPVTVRHARTRDIPAISGIHREFQGQYLLGMDCSLELRRHFLARARARHDHLTSSQNPAAEFAPAWYLALDRDRPVAYARVLQEGETFSITEAGHRKGREHALRAILRERTRGVPGARIKLTASRRLVDSLGCPILEETLVSKMMYKPLSPRGALPPELRAEDHCIWPEFWF